MADHTLGDLLGAVESIGPLIAKHAAAAEADRQLSGADRLLAIGEDCAVRLKEPFRSADHGDDAL